MPLHISFVMLCALVFYFVYSNLSKFEPILNSNEFAVYKKIENLKENSYFPKSLWAESYRQPALFYFLFHPTWPICRPNLTSAAAAMSVPTRGRNPTRRRVTAPNPTRLVRLPYHNEPRNLPLSKIFRSKLSLSSIYR
jgi:hypothetical protein